MTKPPATNMPPTITSPTCVGNTALCSDTARKIVLNKKKKQKKKHNTTATQVGLSRIFIEYMCLQLPY